MQHLLNRAKWGADAVRDDLCEYVVENLHGAGHEAGTGRPHDRPVPGRRPQRTVGGWL